MKKSILLLFVLTLILFGCSKKSYPLNSKDFENKSAFEITKTTLNSVLNAKDVNFTLFTPDKDGNVQSNTYTKASFSSQYIQTTNLLMSAISSDMVKNQKIEKTDLGYIVSLEIDIQRVLDAFEKYIPQDYTNITNISISSTYDKNGNIQIFTTSYTKNSIENYGKIIFNDIQL